MNREQWLREYISRLRPMFRREGMEFSKRVDVSFASRGIRGTKHTLTLAETWRADGRRKIRVNPAASDPIQIGAILIHELCHDVADQSVEEHTHRSRVFRDAHARMGLIGPATESQPSAELQVRLAKIVIEIGGLPDA